MDSKSQPQLILPNPEKDQSQFPSQVQPSASTTTPANKRRRVTRACDECRKKKVRCDGKQPCIHCTVYSYNCTYQSPNTRNKKSAVPPEKQTLSMITAAVNKSHSQQQQLRTQWATSYTPGVINDLSNNNNLVNLNMYKNIVKLLFPRINFDDAENSIIDSTMKLEKLEKVISYLNNSKVGTGESITLNEINDLYSDGQSPLKFNSERMERQSSVSSLDDSASVTSTSIGREIKIILPSKEKALKLIFTTWNEACVLFRFYHRPSLLEEVDLLYSIDPMNYTDRQQKFLPFMYSILAVGSLFSKVRTPNPNTFKESPNQGRKSSEDGISSNETLEDDGFRYFMAARKLIDITNVGDIISIQTIVMMVLYLQCSARLSTCYSYIGIALRSALKEGLHRNLTIFQNSKKHKLTPIEIDTRKRLFYTIYKMDIYINSLLGLPRSIHEDEFDQEYPEELDDENITADSFNYDQQGGRLSSAGCANHHTKLMLIISHIVKDLYPIKLHKKDSGGSDRFTPEYTHMKVTEIEYELKNWLDNLPLELKPTDPNVPDSNKHIPKKFVLANCYLHLAFLNCQIMLYRPFIHFISNGTVNRQSDPRSLIRGRNCIKVARMVVKLANKMIDQNLLIGTYWFSMYTIFFSIACLIYYFHFANYTNTNGNTGVNYAGVLFDDDLNIDMIKKDIEIGRKVLDCLKNNSNSSLRIFNILKNLFEQLNRRTATNSKGENGNGTEAIHGGETNTEILKLNEEIKDKNLESTFLNFDSMNNFSGSGISTRKGSASPSSASLPSVPSTTNSTSSSTQFFGDHITSPVLNQKPALETTISSDDAMKKHPLSQSISIEDHNLIQPNVDNSAYSTDNQTNDEYMPGVIDKLDAQIFGRILPPYMLEKNVKYAAAASGNRSGSETPAAGTSAALAESAMHDAFMGGNGNGSNINDNPFDFAQLDNLMYDDSIDQLDPFNPFYG